MNRLQHIVSAVVLAASVGLGLSTPAHAQVPTPCELFLCMAGRSGFGTSGPSCATSSSYWSAPSPAGLAVYYYVFIPVASQALRYAYLNQCPGAASDNPHVLQAIMSQWGAIP